MIKQTYNLISNFKEFKWFHKFILKMKKYIYLYFFYLVIHDKYLN